MSLWHVSFLFSIHKLCVCRHIAWRALLDEIQRKGGFFILTVEAFVLTVCLGPSASKNLQL